MDTRETILQEALQQYNGKGFGAVTTRHIAAAMNISPGNLHYHFKHTEDIVSELFNRLTAAYDNLLVQLKGQQLSSAEGVDFFLEQSFNISYQYRFILLSFMEISQQIPDIRKKYSHINKLRQQEFMLVFHQLIQQGVFRKDIPDTILEVLVRNIFILADFWHSHNAVSEGLKGKKALEQYKQSFRALFFPYLTKKGMEYFEIK